MEKAVVYCRYSSHNQTEQSIEGQLHDAYAYAERENMQITAEYIDRAVSGKTDNRDDFQRMLFDAQRRRFTVVLVWKLDRFARNRYDSARNKAFLKRFGVRVVSVMENISDTPEGIILEGMLESMAEYYSANLSVNIKRGQRETLSKGLYTGGVVPYGFINQNKKLIPDEKTAPVVRFIFESYASGMQKKEIAAQLNAKGIRRPGNQEWSMKSFSAMIRNPLYYGTLIRGETEYPDYVEPIISKELFDRAQLRVEAHRHAPAANRGDVRYLLQGKLFCGLCGSPMQGNYGKNRHGTMYYYYACANRRDHHSCTKRHEHKEELERYVLTRTLHYVLTPDVMDKIAAAIIQEYKNEFSDSKIAEIEKTIKRLDAEMDKLVDAIIELPKSARAKIAERMELIEIQKSEAAADLEKLRAAAGIRYSEEEILAWLRRFCSGDLDDPDFCRDIIDTFVNSVYVYDDRVMIFYNIGSPNHKPTDFSTASSVFAIEPSCSTNEFKRKHMLVINHEVFAFVFYDEIREII